MNRLIVGRRITGDVCQKHTRVFIFSTLEEKHMSEQRMITCPNCGASLRIDDDRDIFFCEYCGTKIRKESDHSYTKVEQEIRYIDEARLKEAELKIKELESQNTPPSIKNSLKFFASVLLVIICMFIPFILAVILCYIFDIH